MKAVLIIITIIIVAVSNPVLIIYSLDESENEEQKQTVSQNLLKKKTNINNQINTTIIKSSRNVAGLNHRIKKNINKGYL